MATDAPGDRIGSGLWRATLRVLLASRLPTILLLVFYASAWLVDDVIGSGAGIAAHMLYVLAQSLLLWLLWALLAAAAHRVALADLGHDVPSIGPAMVLRLTWASFRVFLPPLLMGFAMLAAVFVFGFDIDTGGMTSEALAVTMSLAAGVILEGLTLMALVWWGTALPAAVAGRDGRLATAQSRGKPVAAETGWALFRGPFVLTLVSSCITAAGSSMPVAFLVPPPVTDTVTGALFVFAAAMTAVILSRAYAAGEAALATGDGAG